MNWRKWFFSTDAAPADDALMQAYWVFAHSEHGQLLMDHWATSAYLTVYEGKDPVEMAVHNGRRSMVHEIFLNCDMARNPDKYRGQLTEN